MQVRRPQLMILLGALPIALIADSRNIVCQGIQPHINHMLVVKIHRDPPLKGGSGNAQILQPRQKEIIHHLVLAGYGLNKFRMIIYVLDQPVCILAHFEKISFFPGRLHLPAAIRAFAVHQLGLRPE